MQIFATVQDHVIKSSVSVGLCTYQFAIDNLHPLLDRFGEQRKIQSKSFYARLKADILKGCVMPPITLAFDHPEMAHSTDAAAMLSFVIDNVDQGYILDGMQRLNTLKSASEDIEFNRNGLLPVNVIVAEKYDLLLYRMITLNNGQRPMTARHQIEMLTRGLLDSAEFGIEIVTEKETETKNPRGAFKQSDISEAYIAFMSDNVNNQNARIIASKLDELLVVRVMESNLSEEKSAFIDILRCVDQLSQNAKVKDWLRLGNNLIGFTVGAKRSLAFLQSIDADDFLSGIEKFEASFEALEASKVNVGRVRREWAREFVSKIDAFIGQDQDLFDRAFVKLTMAE
jgi:hypothetical protein